MCEIRIATERDLSSVAEIYEKIHTLEEANNACTGWKRGVYPTERTARDALHRGELYVCVSDGEVAASAIFNSRWEKEYDMGDWHFPADDSHVLVMHTLTVDPTAGGRGIGRAMVAFYEQLAAERHCTVLRMDTNEINVRARELYRRLGFREAGVVPCSFQGLGNVRLVLLEKQVSG